MPLFFSLRKWLAREKTSMRKRENLTHTDVPGYWEIARQKKKWPKDQQTNITRLGVGVVFLSAWNNCVRYVLALVWSDTRGITIQYIANEKCFMLLSGLQIDASFEELNDRTMRSEWNGVSVPDGSPFFFFFFFYLHPCVRLSVRASLSPSRNPKWPLRLMDIGTCVWTKQKFSQCHTYMKMFRFTHTGREHPDEPITHTDRK